MSTAPGATVIRPFITTPGQLQPADAAETISAACGCVIAGGLLVGMLFEGWPRRAGHGATLALVAVVSAVLFVLLTRVAGTLS